PGVTSAARTVPTASQPLALTPVCPAGDREPSSNDDEVLDLLEGGRAEDLACPEIVDRRERLFVACGDDLGRGHGTDPRQGVELGGSGAVEIDRADAVSGPSGLGRAGRPLIGARREDLPICA